VEVTNVWLSSLFLNCYIISIILKNPRGHTRSRFMKIYFSDFFEVRPSTVERYGAFNVSLINDLPLFIDPFLLFNSRKRKYRLLHDQIIRYLRFLRDKSVSGDQLDDGLIRAWYAFPEIRQNWLGFTVTGNRGSGLGSKFAFALHSNLNRIFTDFGNEEVTKGSHLEKLCLIGNGVGKDNISDFTTNLVKDFLLEYTQAFAQKQIKSALRKKLHVSKVRFNYQTETWEGATYDLPYVNEDYVLLSPKDILSRDDTWINKTDLIDDFDLIPEAIPDDQLRAQVNNYFKSVLRRPPARKGKRPPPPTKNDERDAAFKTVQQFPQIVDFYIRFKEDNGEKATSISSEKVAFSEQLYVEQFKQLADQLAKETGFYNVAGTTYAEAFQRVQFLKDVIENKDGYRIFYIKGKPIEREEDLQILYRLTWYATSSDVNREVNNGRGPVDFTVSRGKQDKTAVEFKLARNSQLERNLEHQVAIYEKASDAQRSLKVIIYFSKHELDRVMRILNRLKLVGREDIVLIDARRDNKPSASKAMSH
jgi:hypothetical protein